MQSRGKRYWLEWRSLGRMKGEVEEDTGTSTAIFEDLQCVVRGETRSRTEGAEGLVV